MRLLFPSFTLWAVVVLLAISPVRAGELPAPNGPVILTVDGAIANHNGDGIARFDMEMLTALGVHKIVTETSWTEGKVEFEGVLARAVMAAVGANGTSVKAFAINDYHSDVPVSNFDDYDVILAFAMNGKALTRRDKGPLWIIYPWDDHPELNEQSIIRQSVWLLKHLTVQ